MATWHQQQAMRRAYKARRTITLWHSTMWVVICDPLNGMMTSMVWATKEQAEKYLERLTALGKAAGCYILPPGGKS
jgi:hypothetical protein